MIKEIAAEFPMTKIWMDSMKLEDLEFGRKNSNVGVTTAPTVGPACLEAEYEMHIPAIKRLIREMPEASERKILWAWMYETVKERSKAWMDLYGDGTTDDGHFAIQMNVFDYRNAGKMMAQADIIGNLFPNNIVKIPATAAGLQVMEESVAKGYSVLSTMSTSVSQVIAAAEAQKRGLERRKAAGLDCSRIALICAMQMTIPEMCIRNFAKQNGIALSEDAVKYASVAVSKKTYHLLKEKGLSSTLMLSNFSHHEQWLEFLGGDMILTMPGWFQRQIEESSCTPEDRIDREIPAAITDELLEKIPFYRDLYEENAAAPEDFENLVTFAHTAQFFMKKYDNGIRLVRNIMLPNTYADEA